jgi:leucyl aminopeptidase
MVVRGVPDLAAGARAFADGLMAPAFDGGTYKDASRAARADRLRSLTVTAPGGDAKLIAGAAREGQILGECANVSRGLANEPGNVLTPTEFASRVRTAAERVGLAVEVLERDQMEALGMHLLLGVSRGSAEAPRLVVIRHEPKDAVSDAVLGLVGKGVTFDTGGISLKPADSMDRMKDDMAGGAAVVGAMLALARLGGRHRVIGVIPMVENMPGGRAIRPGDVLRGASGRTVEVINTDAEGRLILADALWYARRLGATHLVDVATLTGACVVALGHALSGLFGNQQAWVDVVREAAAAGGDRVWAMPIYEEALEQMRSEIADLVNSGGRAGGAVTAAVFLREFAGDGPWAHLDIAGTAWAEKKEPYQPKGATGVAVRTLTALGLSGGVTSRR